MKDRLSESERECQRLRRRASNSEERSPENSISVHHSHNQSTDVVESLVEKNKNLTLWREQLVEKNR